MSAHQPEFDAFCALADQGNLIPVYREILADLDTPVSAFLKLDDGGDAFLLESVEGGEKWARYSFLGTAPSRILSCTGDTVSEGPPGGPFTTRTTSDPLGEARAMLAAYTPVAVPGLPRFAGGLVGFLGYDLVRSFETPAGDGPRRSPPSRLLSDAGRCAGRLRQGGAEDEGRRACARRCRR